MQPIGTANIHIMDIYHGDTENGFNWQALKNQGFDGIVMKVSEGTGYTDPEFKKSYAAARAVGLKTGFYMFFHFYQEAAAQVQKMIDVIPADFIQDYIPMLDVERSDTNVINSGNRATVVSRVKTALDLIKAKWGNAILYADWGTLVELTPASQLNMYPLWIADYTGAVNDAPGWSGWTVHQYSGTPDYNWATTGIYLNQSAPPSYNWYITANTPLYANNGQTTGNDASIPTGSVLQTVPLGAVVNLERYLAGETYARINYNGNTGWVLLSLLSQTAPTQPPETYNWIVVIDNTQMYANNGQFSGNDASIPNGAIINTLPIGAVVTLERYIDGEAYARINYGGVSGWIPLGSISASGNPIPTIPAHLWHVTRTSLVMRQADATTGNDPLIGVGKKIKSLKKSDKVTLVRWVPGEKYAKVSNLGVVGWVFLAGINY